jgi:predicted nucleotidyltransferase
MDVSSPLRSLVPSLDSAVLEVLSRSESSFGPTQIARLAGRGSRPGIQLVLDRLVEHGLVIANPTNRGYMYRLNRDHLLTPAVLSAVSVRHELLVRLTSAVHGLIPRPVHASVFGSFARGGGDQDSDIDLFLLVEAGFDAEPNWASQMRQLEDRVLGWTGNRLEMLTLDRDSLAAAVQRSERIVEELRTDAIVLLGPDIESLTTSDVHQVAGA